MKGKRKFKKLISGVLASAVLTSAFSSVCVFADNNGELEETIVKVKSIIEIPSYLSEFNSRKYSVGNGVEYELIWTKKESEEFQDSFDEYSGINVRVNKNGDIERYTAYNDNDENKKKFAKLSDEKYKEIAENRIKKVSAEIQGDYEFESINSSINSPDVDVIFKRVKNGIDYCDNNISVSIDKETGDVTSYILNHLYTNDAPDASAALDENAKRAAFTEQSGGFDKFYITKGDTKEAVLVYSPKNSNLILDSLTGKEPELTSEEQKRIDENKDFYGNYKEMAAADAAELNGVTENMSMYSGGGGSASADRAKLTENEISEIESYSNLISPQDAEKLIRGIENTVIGECELSSYRYFKQSEEVEPMPVLYAGGEDSGSEETVKDVYYAEFSFAKEIKDDKDLYRDSYIDATVKINAETGELISLYSYEYNDEEKSKTVEKSVREQNAVDFIKKYSPKEADRVKNFDNDSEDVYRFIFNESVNGIKYKDNAVYVSVNENSGKIMEFSKTWTDDIKFESADNILSEKDAANILFDKIGFNQYYENIAYVEYAPAIRLAYGLNNGYPYYVSAVSGKLLDYDGTEKAESADGNNIGFTDIDDYFAKDMINELVRNDVIKVSEDRRFRPNDLTTYNDIEELIEALRYNPIWYYRNGNNNSVLDEISKKENLTRLDSVIYIVESVNYGKAARLKGVYNCGFNDADEISDDKIGYAAVAKGLGIVNGDENGCFNPNTPVTRGELAVMIYNLLDSETLE